MAINTTQHFRNADKVVAFRYPVTDTAADVFAVDATYLRDLTKLTCINTSASPVTLSIYESDGINHDLVHVISIPANAGTAAGSPAIRLMQDPTYQLQGVRFDAFGNYFLRIAKGKKLRAVASTTAVLVLVGELEGYEA